MRLAEIRFKLDPAEWEEMMTHENSDGDARKLLTRWLVVSGRFDLADLVNNVDTAMHFRYEAREVRAVWDLG